MNGAVAFHLAFPVDDLEAARRFYVDVLGCRVGRSAERWIDFDFFGHQISAHLTDGAEAVPTNPVDGDAVPVRHFGAVLTWSAWEHMLERFAAHDIHPFVGPRVRFEGQPGEQGTVFVRDPAGNAIELKAFRDPTHLFAT